MTVTTVPWARSTRRGFVIRRGSTGTRSTGDLLMADIGQSVVETLNVVPAGGDLGWNTWEGSYRVVTNTRVELSNPRGEPVDHLSGG